jgi:hypothetical protein
VLPLVRVDKIENLLLASGEGGGHDVFR